MSIEDAVDMLWERLKGEPWLIMIVASSTDQITVFVKDSRDVHLPLSEEPWKGYPVVIKQLGKLEM